MTRGKFIVLYGINNLGKTTQAKLLVERLQRTGRKAEYWKYPINMIAPTGELLNRFLREGNPHHFTVREFQFLHVINRLQAQATLTELLNDGACVVAEDYRGTGMAWGIGAGVDRNLMKELNQFLFKEDIAFLFRGKRFLESRERNHQFENNDELIERVAKIHDELGQEFGWLPIDANESIEAIHAKIWTEVEKILSTE